MPARFVLAVAMLVLAGCVHFAPIEYANRAASTAISDPQATPLGRKGKRLVANQAAERSGFLLLDRGEEALVWRGMLADRATRTIDAQYFIWNQDNVGTIAAERLLQAAERGVRVRVIVDELSIDANPRFLALLNAHPLVEIRLYNPVGSLGLGVVGKVAKILRTLGDFPRLNRRMHNKVFVVDGSVAILGGRNVADEYYDLNSRHNFRDRDVLAMGPIVPHISNGFDDYWNDPWVVPIEAALDLRVTPEERDAYYRQLHDYASQPKNFPPRFADSLADIGARFDALDATGMYWGRARLVYDRPGKNPDVDRLDAFGESGRQLTELALGTRRELIAETPYLVMLRGTYDLLERLRDRGVRVALITNSMAATDAMWVHASYAFQRRRLLGMGVELFEYRADAQDRSRLISRYELMEKETPMAIHAKTMVIDREAVFIGSFNMDPRSTHINTEIGLIIESPALAEDVAQLIEQDMAPHNSWRLQLTSEGPIEWTTLRNGRPLSYDAEPDVGFGKAMKFLLLAILPITPLM
jgi:cardiolipin synthase C